MDQKTKDLLAKAGKELLFEVLRALGQKITTTATALQTENERITLARPVNRNLDDLKFKYGSHTDKGVSE